MIPTLRYENAPAAIEWLCEAFGFEKHLVVPGEKGKIAHAQLVFGNGMIMLGSAGDDDFGVLAHFFDGVIHDDHRAVRQVADSLVWVFALLDQQQLHLVARAHDRAHGSREFVEVENVKGLC